MAKLDFVNLALSHIKEQFHACSVYLESVNIAPLPREFGSQQHRITAHVSLTMDVEFLAHECSICSAETPLPADADALMYVLKYHDGRMCWGSSPVACWKHKGTADYPTKNWEHDPEFGLVCPDCAAQMKVAREAVIESIRQKKELIP